MAQANDSVLVTPGSGATIATHMAAAKEHQVTMQADASGHILGTKPTYLYNIGSTAHVAAANTVMWDLFNAHATLVVRVFSIRQLPNVTTAVTGILFDWKLARTTAVGTGGTAQTALLADLSDAALNASITCRLKPTGGATEGSILFNYTIHSEETNTTTQDLAAKGGLELVPAPLLMPNGPGIVLRQNQGLRVVQITNSAQGNTGWLIGFTVE